MRRLVRPPTAPACLARFDHQNHTWDDVSPTDKAEIREVLTHMQGRLCAYCESELYSDYLPEPDFSGAHIEHFRRKNRKHYPELTFEWYNLFLSCETLKHCGHYKDRNGAPYNPDELIKPDEHDPDDVMFFGSNGEARPRAGCNPHDKKRAEETIRVFHLNAPCLTGARLNAMRRYRTGKGGRDLDEAIALRSEDGGIQYFEEWLAEELMQVQNQPYTTTLRHFLKSR